MLCCAVVAPPQVLHDIGEKHGVSPSCVATRWVLQQPGVSGVILGARNTTHLRVRDAGVAAAAARLAGQLRWLIGS